MNDDQLSRELARRASGADAPDLLPAIRSAIDTRPAPVRSSRLAPLAGVIGVTAALLLLVVALPRLGPGDGQPSPSQGPESATVRSGDFSITITSIRAQYAAGEVIEVEASLLYDGDQPEVTVGGSNTLIGFGIEQVDGTLRMDPASDASCNLHTLAAGVDLVEPFSKSGGYSDTDPDADFWREYFSDPSLQLPTGAWRIKAIATFGLDECRSSRSLEASILVTVGAQPEPEPSSEAPTPDVAPTQQAAPPEASVIHCPPVRESLGAVAPTVIDATGLVERCVAATPVGGPPVTNPGGDLSVLQLDWSGSSCDAAATISLTGTAGSYDVRITPAAGLCRLILATYAIQLELRGQIAAEEVNVTHGEPPELGSAWWELAPHERPTSASTELDVVVYEQACASGQSPEGRIVGPEIEYDVGVVSITFHVTPLPGAGDCQLVPGVPMTVQLTEPLGDRRINDGGFNSVDVVIEASNELLAISSSRVDELAYERFEAMAGADACIGTAMTDRVVPTQAELEAAVEALRGADGRIPGRGYASENWLSAARALGAIEAYGGRPKPWYIVTAGEGSPRMSSLNPTPISGRTVWFVGDQDWVVLPHCGDPSATPGPSPVPRGEAPNFELATGATQREYASGEAIDVWSSFTSNNDVTVMCLSGPTISLEQLDGPLTFTPGPFVAMCPGPRELRSDEPVTHRFMPAVWALSEPHPLEPYMRDDELFLPPGTYRFTAASSFDLGDTRRRLEASIIVTVR